MTQNTIRVGMIGAGFIGQLAHLMNFVEVEGCSVVALADLRPQLRARVAARFGIPRTYASHTELLRDADIDAVVVVTPRTFTGPVVLDCLRAGKHVLSEKPMAGSIEHGRRLVEEARRQEVTYAVGYMKRYDEGVEQVKLILDEALKTGELGSLLSVHARCFMGNSYCNAYGHVVTSEQPQYTSGGWRMAPDWLPAQLDAAYGAFLNTHSHLTNLLRFLFGRTPSVKFASMSRPSQTAVLDFGDFLATLETGKTSQAGWDEEVRMTFSDGELHLALPPALLRNVPASVKVYRAGKRQERVQPMINWSWAFLRQARAFVADVQGRQPSRISGEEALEDLVLAEALWRAELDATT